MSTLPVFNLLPLSPPSLSLSYRFSIFSSPLSSPQSQTLTLTLTRSLSFSYGPSLFKGHNPNPPNPNQDPTTTTFDKSLFSRAFDVAALRVPAADCSALERRLRGHLLNWPRIRNVARVEGDDIDPHFKNLLQNPPSVSEDRLNSLQKEKEMVAVSPVIYRAKLVRDFNCRGFIKFRNLAKISRPKRGKTKEGGGGGLEGGRGKGEVYEVEVVGEEEEEEDWSGLMGEEFKGGKWRGATRLLLLDERYAKKGVDEMPEAVKVVLMSDTTDSKLNIFELVQCQLTLYYNYWQMNEVLEALLPEAMLVPTGFETVGHIAHLNLREEHLPYKKLIGQVVLDKNKPKIQTVVNKIDAIQNDYRTMELEVLAGNHSLVTAVIESALRFEVDLAKVYWNSRLATERQRLVSCFSELDVICDVFAGAGPIAISAAKRVKYVYANDLNPNAVEYLERNIVRNKLDSKIKVSNMEGRRFIHSVFTNQRGYVITQVVMNLPKDAVEFLDCFRGIFGKQHKDIGYKLPKIHIYGFSKAENPEFDFHERINVALCEAVKEVEMHRVRLVAPGKWMLCASFNLSKSAAFAKSEGATEGR